MHSNLKRRLAIGVVAVAAAAFAGGAYAATKDSNANTRQAFLNDVARRLHVTPAQLTSALEGAEMDQLNAAVASGKLTQAQANALKQRIQHGHPLLGAPGLFRAGPGFAPPFAPGGKFRRNFGPRGLVPPTGRAGAVPPKPGAPVPFPKGPRLLAPGGRTDVGRRGLSRTHPGPAVQGAEQRQIAGADRQGRRQVDGRPEGGDGRLDQVQAGQGRGVERCSRAPRSSGSSAPSQAPSATSSMGLVARVRVGQSHGDVHSLGAPPAGPASLVPAPAVGPTA